MSVQLIYNSAELYGEDFAEFLDEINLSFWVDLTEIDVEGAATAGELFDKIMSKIGDLGSSRCLTSVAFYQLRRSLVAVTGLEKRSIRPDTILHGLLPAGLRVKWWEAINGDSRLRLPRLRPGRLAMVAYCGIAVLGGLTYFASLSNRVSWEFKFVLPWAAAVGVWWAWRLAERLPREFPVDTFGDLVRVVVTLNQRKLAESAGGSTVSQAWAAFQEMLGGACNVSAKSITRNTLLP